MACFIRPLEATKRWLCCQCVGCCRSVDNFLEVGGLKTVNARFLHYHAHFCMTTPHFIMFAQKSGGALAPPYLHPCVVEAAEVLNSLDMSQQQKSQTCWLGTMRGYS